MRIYVVEGSTGEYDGHTTWLVKAFFEEEKAKALRDKLEDLCKKNDLTCGRYCYSCTPITEEIAEKEKALAKVRELDHDARFSYTGTEYIFYELELV